MKQMAYLTAVLFGVLLGFGVVESAFGQTDAKSLARQTVVIESDSFGDYARKMPMDYLNKAARESDWTPRASAEQIVPTLDPKEQAAFIDYFNPSAQVYDEFVQTIPSRTEGDYSTQVVIVTVIPPSNPQTRTNAVTAPQARAIIFANNGLSVKNYWEEISGGALRVVSRLDQNGEAIDIFTVSIQAPWDNCNFRLLNEYPSLIDAQLPTGNKIADKHATFMVFNQEIYTIGGCISNGQATVPAIRMMNRGARIWMSEQMFLSDQFYSYHEFGHTLGLGHSKMTWSNGSPDPLTWPAFEYGDPACVMANSTKRLNSYHMHRLGWHNQNNAFKELGYPGSVYTIIPPTQLGSIWSKKLLGAQNSFITVRDASGNPINKRIYPEIRQNYRFDDFRSNLNYRTFTEGPAFRWGEADIMSPLGWPSYLINAAGTFDSGSAPLITVGQSFTIWNFTFALQSRYVKSSGARFTYAASNTFYSEP